MRRVRSALVLLALWPLPVLASVFLNGVRIDGLKNQTFDKVSSVRLDEQGNIHIVAPGYSVKAVESAPVAPPVAPPAPAPSAAAPVAPAPTAPDTAPATLTRRYWLVTEQSAPGKTEYDIDVFINSAWVRKLRNGEGQVITELTASLKPGKNSVRLMAAKVRTGPRRSESATDTFQVIIGEGNEGGGRVMLDKPLIRFERNAAQTDDAAGEFTLTTR